MKKISYIVTFLLTMNFLVVSAEQSTEISFYSGVFDTIDKEGDDKATLFGIEHRNNDLFKNTILGKFAPITGGFITDNSSIFLYTGVEAIYDLGPLSFKPSFSPGFYEAGDGKDLGSALEFKSEIRIDLNIFENTKFGYAYSHVSNNDWGNINPGIDNQSITFSRNF